LQNNLLERINHEQDLLNLSHLLWVIKRVNIKTGQELVQKVETSTFIEKIERSKSLEEIAFFLLSLSVITEKKSQEIIHKINREMIVDKPFRSDLQFLTELDREVYVRIDAKKASFLQIDASFLPVTGIHLPHTSRLEVNIADHSTMFCRRYSSYQAIRSLEYRKRINWYSGKCKTCSFKNCRVYSAIDLSLPEDMTKESEERRYLLDRIKRLAGQKMLAYVEITGLSPYFYTPHRIQDLDYAFFKSELRYLVNVVALGNENVAVDFTRLLYRYRYRIFI
ncbi:MAG: hypothetical protein ACFFD4_38220, partial [Candidatus Odinarchaeota archaeon]